MNSYLDTQILRRNVIMPNIMNYNAKVYLRPIKSIIIIVINKPKIKKKNLLDFLIQTIITN